MVKLHKEIPVIVEGENKPNYGQLMDILYQSQQMALRQFGATDLAVYKLDSVYGR